MAKKYRIPFRDVTGQAHLRGQHLVFVAPTVLLLDKGKEVCRESRFIRFRELEECIERK